MLFRDIGTHFGTQDIIRIADVRKLGHLMKIATESLFLDGVKFRELSLCSLLWELMIPYYTIHKRE